MSSVNMSNMQMELTQIGSVNDAVMTNIKIYFIKIVFLPSLTLSKEICNLGIKVLKIVDKTFNLRFLFSFHQDIEFGRLQSFDQHKNVSFLLKEVDALRDINKKVNPQTTQNIC